MPEQSTDTTDLRAWTAGERAHWERERGHLTEHPCPGVWVHPDRCGGEPCLDGYRLPTAALYARWQLERDLVNGDDFAAIRELATDYRIASGMQAVRVAVAFEAGRRWGEQRDRAERKRRTVTTVMDCLAWLAEGERRGIRRAAGLLRRLAQDELAAQVEALGTEERGSE